jgi:hypothetical protein
MTAAGGAEGLHLGGRRSIECLRRDARRSPGSAASSIHREETEAVQHRVEVRSWRELLADWRASRGARGDSRASRRLPGRSAACPEPERVALLLLAAARTLARCFRRESGTGGRSPSDRMPDQAHPLLGGRHRVLDPEVGERRAARRRARRRPRNRSVGDEGPSRSKTTASKRKGVFGMGGPGQGVLRSQSLSARAEDRRRCVAVVPERAPYP